VNLFRARFLLAAQNAAFLICLGSFAILSADAFAAVTSQDYVDRIISAAVPLSAKGVAGGVATLDETGKVPFAQLPPIPAPDTMDSATLTAGADTTGKLVTAQLLHDNLATAAQGVLADNAVLTTAVTQSMAGAYTVTGSFNVPTQPLPLPQ